MTQQTNDRSFEWVFAPLNETFGKAQETKSTIEIKQAEADFVKEGAYAEDENEE